MKFFRFLSPLLFVLPSLVTGGLSSFAQTVATENERTIGSTGCKNSATAPDFDTIAQCTSTTSTSGTMQKAPLYAGVVTAPPYASTACDSSKAGMMQYSSTYGFVGCDGSSWSDVRQVTTSKGLIMPDGTLSAGYNKYIMPCDIGMSGTYGSCTGTRTQGTLLTLMQACLSSTAYGHNDWYLPNFAEFYSVMVFLGGSLGFDLTGTYTYQTSAFAASATATPGSLNIVLTATSMTTPYVLLSSATAIGRCIRR